MMGITRKRRSGLVLVFAVSLVLAQAAVALGAKPGTQASQTDGNDYHVITFQDDPVATYDGGVRNYRATNPERGQGFDAHSPASEAYAGYLRGVHGDYVRWLQQRAPEVEVVRDLVYASNAIAVKLNGADPKLLSQGPGVKYTTPSDLYRPTMDASVELINVPWDTSDATDDGARANAGSGVKVGVIDSGIDSEHPFIGSCRDGGMEVSHQVFVSGNTTGVAETVLYGTPSDEALVFDHGTHVAGTIGGCVRTDALDGIVGVEGDPMSGVAPGVELHDYNVFPGYGAGYIAYGGSAFSHDIAAAIEKALIDGMDVINMSLGGGVQGPHDYLAEVSDAASEWMVVVTSAGNAGSGGDGDYATVGSPGSAAGVVTVGASTNSRAIGLEIFASNGDTYPAAVGIFDPFKMRPVTGAPLDVWPGDGLACSPIAPGTFTSDEVVLIHRGTCAFTSKVQNAQDAGAGGVIVANNDPDGGPIAMGGTLPVGLTIPAVGTDYDSGQTMEAEVSTSGLAVSIDGSQFSVLMVDENEVAGFSSRGPAPFTWLVKPDLVAPGVNIRSSVFEGMYDQFQGTSMASPHVAGAAALVIAADGSLAPHEVKGKLVASASRPTPLVGLSALTRGNGLLDVAGAIAQDAWADPVSVSFGVFTGGAPVSGEMALDVHGTSCTATTTGDSTGGVTYAGGMVTMDAGRAPSGQYEGELSFTCAEGSFTVPWWFHIDRRGS